MDEYAGSRWFCRIPDYDGGFLLNQVKISLYFVSYKFQGRPCITLNCNFGKGTIFNGTETGNRKSFAYLTEKAFWMDAPERVVDIVLEDVPLKLDDTQIASEERQWILWNTVEVFHAEG